MIHFCKPKKSSFFFNNKGFSIIEAIVGITLAALLLVAFTALISQTIKINHANTSGLKATMYLQELIEIAKDLEQSATPTIFFATGVPSPCINCHPEIIGGIWNLVSGPEPLEGFATRTMTISPVSRNPVTNEIETTYDFTHDSTSTKMATATITWYDGSQSHTSKLETYLYYYGQ